jgi:hypothetical protein
MTPFLVLTVVLGTSNFPPALATLSGGPVPMCSLCHQGPTMRGTVTTPFGMAMRQRGLMAGDESSMKRAFMAMATAQVDSDGDGQADVDELKAGGDPHVGPGTPAAPVPEYGCRTSSGFALWVLLVAGGCRRSCRQRLSTTDPEPLLPGV